MCLRCLADLQAGRADLGALAAEVAVPPLPGVAGGAARREYERRVAVRAERLAQRGRIVRFERRHAPASRSPPAPGRWARSARSGSRPGCTRRSDRGVLALHDRRIPGSRANIDHIAVGPAGVYVIDAKRVRERPDPGAPGGAGLFSPRRDELLVRGRVRNNLVAGVEKQVAVVRAALDAAGLGDVPVTGVLCFVDGLFPLVREAVRRRGHLRRPAQGSGRSRGHAGADHRRGALLAVLPARRVAARHDVTPFPRRRSNDVHPTVTMTCPVCCAPCGLWRQRLLDPLPAKDSRFEQVRPRRAVPPHHRCRTRPRSRHAGARVQNHASSLFQRGRYADSPTPLPATSRGPTSPNTTPTTAARPAADAARAATLTAGDLPGNDWQAEVPGVLPGTRT